MSASSVPTSAASASSAPGKGRPATTTRARDWSARQPILVTYSLMAINLAVFVWMVAHDRGEPQPGWFDHPGAGRPRPRRAGAGAHDHRHGRVHRHHRSVVPAGVVGIPALRVHPPRLQHVLAVPARPAPRTSARAGPFRACCTSPRCSAGRPERCCAAQRPARWSIGRRVRPVRRRGRDDVAPRHQPA